MGNIYDVASAIQQPNVVGNFNQGVQTAQNNQVFGEKQKAYQQALSDQQNIRALAPQVISGNPNAYSQVAAIDPSQATALQGAGDDQVRRFSGAINMLDQATKTNNPAAIDAAWQQARPYLSQIAGKPAPDHWDPSFQPGLDQAMAHISQLPASAPIKVGAGETLVQPGTYKTIFQGPTKPAAAQYVDAYDTGRVDAQGNKIYQHGYVSPTGFTPLTTPPTGSAPAGLSGAVMQQESGGNPNAVSSAGAQGLMQLMPATAANPGFGIRPAQDGSPQENLRVGKQYLSALMSKYGGNTQLALAAYNAGPGRVDGALSQAGGDPNKALSMLPQETQNYVPAVLGRLGQGNAQGAADSGGIGTSVGMGGGAATDASSPAANNQLAPGEFTKDAKGSQNLIDKREEEVQALIKQGVPVNAQQHQSYLTTGKLAGDADAPLSSGDEAEAQALAAYKLPLSPYSLSKPAMQPIIQRAMQINPNFSSVQYDNNKTVLNDLASSSVGKSGGTLTAAQTALDHLNDMADISQQLPRNMGFVNAGENALGSTFNVGSAPALKAWNQAKTLLAGEAAKMIKGGVASEGEVNDMLSNLNPNDPNRDVALAKVAAFMNDKVEEMQQKRDSVLGPASPGTSLLSAKAQKYAQRVIGLDPHNIVPQFSPAGGMGQATSAAGLPATSAATSAQTSQPQPRAVNSMGHAVVWNGSAWVPE